MDEETLFNNHIHLAENTVYKMFPNAKNYLEGKHLELDDVLQYGRLGLLKACQTWKDEQLGTFRNYAIRNIRWSILKGIEREQLTQTYYKNVNYTYNENRKVTLLSMSMQPYKNSEDEDMTYYDIVSMDTEKVESLVFCNMQLDKMLSKLKESDQEILRMRLYKGMTCDEIAKHYGIRRQAINTKLLRIRKKLNQYREELI
jgi:RNA polymerase sigma factor (sigma-70 family)